MIHLPQACKRFLPLIVATLAGAAPVSAGGFNPETFTLANGMQVVVVPNHRVPIVTHMVWYRVGSADERPGESGIAHFLEHLMFKGTRTHAPGEFSEILALAMADKKTLSPRLTTPLTTKPSPLTTWRW